MFDVVLHFAFIGPGGPEFLLIMLVLLVLFGAKDAPRILRKINELANQIRHTADSFKREVMYGDLTSDASAQVYDDDYDYEDDYEEDCGEHVEGEEENLQKDADAECVTDDVEEPVNKRDNDVTQD